MTDKRKIKVTITKEISSCYHECPYFGLAGHGPVMVCNHSEAPNHGYNIISHPQCRSEFPEKCPLLKKEYLNQNPLRSEKSLINYYDNFLLEMEDKFLEEIMTELKCEFIRQVKKQNGFNKNQY